MVRLEIRDAVVRIVVGLCVMSGLEFHEYALRVCDIPCDQIHIRRHFEIFVEYRKFASHRNNSSGNQYVQYGECTWVDEFDYAAQMHETIVLISSYDSSSAPFFLSIHVADISSVAYSVVFEQSRITRISSRPMGDFDFLIFDRIRSHVPQSIRFLQNHFRQCLSLQIPRAANPSMQFVIGVTIPNCLLIGERGPFQDLDVRG
jgi:hypothetical protein